MGAVELFQGMARGGGILLLASILLNVVFIASHPAWAHTINRRLVRYFYTPAFVFSVSVGTIIGMCIGLWGYIDACVF